MLVFTENNSTYNRYCGQETGTSFWVIGENPVVIFHSDYQKQQKGFKIRFETSSSPGK